jgi:fructose-bisphosphate aldolase, class II
MEAARKTKSPVIIQVSNGGGEFLVGKGVKFADAATAGSVALAMHVRSVAKYYGIPVVLHSDHCAKKLLPWFDGMLKADEEFFAKFGEPLFSSHMLDLSEEPDDENIAICVEYFKRMVPMKIWLEMEIGITGGEEDGVNNENVDPEKLYTSPEQVYAVYDALSKIGNMFSVAAAFGNVHGVYKVSLLMLTVLTFLEDVVRALVVAHPDEINFCFPYQSAWKCRSLPRAPWKAPRVRPQNAQLAIGETHLPCHAWRLWFYG